MKKEQIDDISFKNIEELRKILQTRLQLPEVLFIEMEHSASYMPKCASKWLSLEDVIKEVEPFLKSEVFNIGYVSFKSKRKEVER